MNSKLTKLFIFAAGAVIGSAVTRKVVKTKYKKIADEEIESVKEAFCKKGSEETQKNVEDYYDHIERLKYSTHMGLNPETNDTEEEEGEILIENKPYVIPPEEFGECDYVTKSLTLYVDGVLTDDFDNVIKDVDGLVGRDSLNHFGEYEDDSVFVRNDGAKIDFEILADERKYSEIVK